MDQGNQSPGYFVVDQAFSENAMISTLCLMNVTKGTTDLRDSVLSSTNVAVPMISPLQIWTQFHQISKSWAILASKSWQKSSSTSRTSFSLQTLTKLKPQNLGKRSTKFQLTNPQILDQNTSSKFCQLYKNFATKLQISISESWPNFSFQLLSAVIWAYQHCQSSLHFALRAVICWKGQVKTSTMLLYISLGQWVS